MKIRGPEDFGGIWKKTVDGVAQAGLLDGILYVDLCNEYPLDVWSPFLPKGTLRASPLGTRWMRDGVAIVREAFPRLDYTVSFTTEYDTWREQDVSFLDFLELNLERFESKGYENVVDRAEPLYRQDPAHWQDALRRSIHGLAEWSRVSKKALATTECWALVDYKDWPLLGRDVGAPGATAQLARERAGGSSAMVRHRATGTDTGAGAAAARAPIADRVLVTRRLRGPEPRASGRLRRCSRPATSSDAPRRARR